MHHTLTMHENRPVVFMEHMNLLTKHENRPLV